MDLKQMLFLLVRIGGSSLVAWLAAHGQISSDQATNVIVAVAVALINVIWSIANKVRYGTKIDTALELPAGTSRYKLKEVIANK